MKKKISVHFSSSTPEWATPMELFKKLHDHFHFTLDPCATKENAKCKKYFTRENNGLNQNWGGDCVFMNPPYGREIGEWMDKAFRESRKPGTLVVCLVPARTDTRWWHEFAVRGEIRYLRGRLKFGNKKNCAPFPSALVLFRARLSDVKI